MRPSLIISLVLHAAILLAALVVLPNPKEFKVPPQQAIEVDISRIGDVAKRQAKVKEVEAPKEKPETKKAETVKPVEPAPKKAEKPKEAVREAAAEPPPPVEKKKEAEVKPLDPNPLENLIKDTLSEAPAPKKEEPKKEEAKKEEPKKEEPKKAEVKPKEKPKKKAEKKKPDLDKIAAFLNKIDESQAPDQPSAADGQPEKAETAVAGADAETVNTIVGLLVTRVKECWTVPAGAREANMSIPIHFKLDINGALVGAPAVEGFDPNPLFAATARSAQAALADCAPYDFLPRDQYDLWKDNTLDFNPNMMFAS